MKELQLIRSQDSEVQATLVRLPSLPTAVISVDLWTYVLTKSLQQGFRRTHQCPPTALVPT